MNPNARWNRIIRLLAILLFVSLNAGAQEGGGIYKSDSYFIQAPVPEGDPKATTVDDDQWKADFEESLLPGGKSRFWRSLTFSFSTLDQPDNVFIGESEENPSGFLRNPDQSLSKLDFTLKPGQWFRKSSDFSAAYALGKSPATAGLIDFSTDPLADFQNTAERLEDRGVSKLEFLAWAGKGGTWKRLASAITFTMANSERSRLVGTSVLPPDIQDRDDEATTFSFKLDPKQLIRFPGQLSAAYTALEAHTAISSSNRSGLTNPGASCETGENSANVVRCLEQLSDIQVSGRWLAGLLPEIEIKTTDEFDFVKVGGNFIGSQFLEDSLETVTVTWNLGAALDTANHRREAIKAIALHRTLVKRDTMRNDELSLVVTPPHKIKEGTLLYMPLIAKYKKSEDLPKGSWKAKGVQMLNLKLSGDGILSGYPPAGDWEIVITFKDTYGNVAETRTLIEVV